MNRWRVSSGEEFIWGLETKLRYVFPNEASHHPPISHRHPLHLHEVQRLISQIRDLHLWYSHGCLCCVCYIRYCTVSVSSKTVDVKQELPNVHTFTVHTFIWTKHNCLTHISNMTEDEREFLIFPVIYMWILLCCTHKRWPCYVFTI